MSAGESIQAGERLIPHRPGLDGLRGLSVTAVLLFHGGFTWAVGGYLGVSVFFTLSGYLITSLLLAEFARKGRVDLRHFWGRRFRRLLPASLLALAGIGVFGLTVASAGQADRLAGDIAAAVAYVANWRFILGDTSYGALFADPSPVLHFWSLAIEEQFYLVYPPLMVGLLAVSRGRHLVVGSVLVVLFIASVASSFMLGTGNLDRIYFGTDTRAAELLAGAILAVVVLAIGPRLRQNAGSVITVAAMASLAALTFAVVTVDDRSLWLYRGGFAAFSLLSVAAILGATRDGPLASALGVGPLRWLGTRSYGVYLIHWPVFLWLDGETTGRGGASLFVLRLAVTFAVSELSYRLVETPIRYRRPLPRFVLAAVPGGAAAVIAIGLLATATAPAPLVDLAQSVDRVPPPPTVTSTFTPPAGGAVVVGDTLAPRIAAELADTLTRRTGIDVSDRSTPDCTLVDLAEEQCGDVVDRWVGAATGADVVVVSLGVGEPPTPARASVDTRALVDRLAELRDRLPSTARVVWVTQPLLLAPSDPPALDIDPAQTAWAAQAAVNDAVMEVATAAGQRSIDLARYLRFSELNNGTGESILDHDDERVLLGVAWVADEIVAELGAEVAIPVGTIRLLVVGDSVAYSLGRGLEQWTVDRGDAVVWNAGTTGCGILRDGETPDYEIRSSPACTFWPERFAGHLDEFDPDVVLVMSTGWDLLERRRSMWPAFLGPGDAAFDDYMLDEYRAAVDVLSASGAAVAWGTTPCVSAERAALGSVFDPGRTGSQNQVVRQLAATDDRVVLLDVAAVVCPGGAFVDRVDGVDDFRPDGVHFSDPGSRWVAERIGPALLALTSQG